MVSHAQARPGRAGGFTFVELMVVITIIVILISMAIPIYNQHHHPRQGERAQEQPVHAAHGDRQLHLRQAEGAADARRTWSPKATCEKFPMDPMTGTNQTWRTIMEDASQSVNQSEPGIFDVK